MNAAATRFSAWLDRADRSRSQVAEELSVTPSYITHLAAGRVTPGLGVAAKIEKLTAGKVPAIAWVAPPRKSTRKAAA